MYHKTEEFYEPENCGELFEIVNNISNKFSYIAGGVTINWRGNFFPSLVSLNKIISNAIVETGKIIKIGAGVKLTDLKKLEFYNKNFFNGLIESANLVASPQLRNMATLGGNFISHFDFSDTLGFLYLTAPDIELITRAGIRTVKFADMINSKTEKFTLTDNSVINNFVFDLSQNNIIKTAYIKESRVGKDISTVNASVLKKENAKFDIALGAYFTSIKIFRNLSSEDDLMSALESEVQKPKSDFRSSGDYRKKIIRYLVETVRKNL